MNKYLAKIFFSIPAIRNYAAKQYMMLRYFAAAKTNRLTADWITGLETINKALKGEFKVLLARSRELSANNDYIKGYLKRCVTNVVGPNGFKLQNRAMLGDKPDDSVNRMVEDAWERWGRKENASFNGELSFAEMQKLWQRQLKRDGNVLIRKVIGKNVNSFGFALETLNIEQLDLGKNEVLKNGNTVLMGVEFNKSNKRVAYWIKTTKTEDELSFAYQFDSLRNSVRVPAEEIYHHFVRFYPNQVIGYPETTASLLTMHNLRGYDEATITNARAGASKMGFIRDIPNAAITRQYEGDDVDSEGNIISTFSAGEIEILPPGKEFQGWEPNYPNGEYPNFVKATLRRAAVGLGVAYANWAGDLEAVNFSSMRSGLLDERDNWRDDQSSFVDGLLLPIFNDWFDYAVLSRNINISYADVERVKKPEFIGRRWDWVDPRADIEAKVMAIKNNLSTITDVMAEMGDDFDDYVSRRKRELEKLREIKLLEKELFGEDKGGTTAESQTKVKDNGNGRAKWVMGYKV